MSQWLTVRALGTPMDILTNTINAHLIQVID